MPPGELWEWIAYFNMQDEESRKQAAAAEKKIRTQQAKSARRGRPRQGF